MSPADQAPLASRLPEDSTDSDAVFDQFLDYVTELGIELYPAQEEAILELLSGHNVILNTPTGSGKSLVATALHFKALAEGRRAARDVPHGPNGVQTRRALPLVNRGLPEPLQNRHHQ